MCGFSPCWVCTRMHVLNPHSTSNRNTAPLCIVCICQLSRSGHCSKTEHTPSFHLVTQCTKALRLAARQQSIVGAVMKIATKETRSCGMHRCTAQRNQAIHDTGLRTNHTVWMWGLGWGRVRHSCMQKHTPPKVHSVQLAWQFECVTMEDLSYVGRPFQAVSPGLRVTWLS